MSKALCEFREEAVAELIGVARETIAAIRNGLKKGEYWDLVENHVCISEPALVFILKRLAVDVPLKRARLAGGMSIRTIMEKARLQEPTAPVLQKKDATTTLMVTRLTLNKVILLATHTDKDAPGSTVNGLVRVRVASSANFVPGMTLTAVHRQEDLWELVGRCPRARNKW